MNAAPFEISLISAAGKQTRIPVACNSIQAIRSALATFSEPEGSFAITCRKLAALPDIEEEQPCAA